MWEKTIKLENHKNLTIAINEKTPTKETYASFYPTRNRIVFNKFWEKNKLIFSNRDQISKTLIHELVHYLYSPQLGPSILNSNFHSELDSSIVEEFLCEFITHNLNDLNSIIKETRKQLGNEFFKQLLTKPKT